MTSEATKLIDGRIVELGGWRGQTLARMRALIHEADPEVEELWKWRGTPVFEKHGGICTGEAYKQVVKLTFHKGASLKDPAKLFNASLEGNVRRALDIREGEIVDAAAFKALIREAIALNVAKQKKPASTRGAATRPAPKAKPSPTPKPSPRPSPKPKPKPKTGR